MFFENKEKVWIDGTCFEIPNSCKVDMVNCKDKLYDMSNWFINFFADLDMTNYQS